MKKSKSAVLFAALLLTVFVLTLLCACTPAEKDGVEVIGIAAKDSYPPPVEITYLHFKLSVNSFPSVAFYGGTYYSPRFSVDLYSGCICGNVTGYENYEFIFVEVYDIKISTDPFDNEEIARQTRMNVWAKEL